MKRILALLVLLASVVVVPSAFAGRCAETGDCGTGSGSGGGGGYSQRDSGLWVPNRDGYIQQSAPSAAYPELGKFGQDVVRDVAKDVVKVAGLGLLANAWDAIASAFDALTDEERAALPMMPVK